MKKYLIIAEKKSQQDIIEKVYRENKDSLNYVADLTFINNPVSHISDKILKVEPTNPIWQKLVLNNIDIPEGYYVVNSEYSIKQIELIKNLINSNKYDFIVNACDIDIYGQLSYEYVKEKIGFSIPDKRMSFRDLTALTLFESLQNFRDNNEILANLLKEINKVK